MIIFSISSVKCWQIKLKVRWFCHHYHYHHLVHFLRMVFALVCGFGVHVSSKWYLLHIFTSDHWMRSDASFEVCRSLNKEMNHRKRMYVGVVFCGCKCPHLSVFVRPLLSIHVRTHFKPIFFDPSPPSSMWTSWRHCRRSGIFIVNFEHISNLFLVILLLTLSIGKCQLGIS